MTNHFWTRQLDTKYTLVPVFRQTKLPLVPVSLDLRWAYVCTPPIGSLRDNRGTKHPKSTLQALQLYSASQTLQFY